MTIVTTVCVFFAANPDEALNSDDIETKWGMCSDSTRRSLQYACHKGWLVRTRTPDQNARQRWRWVYTAGPRLLQEIGR